MISIEDSIPSKNDNYRLAEEIFFVQFNDISFFIEDEEQENFYHNILCKLFPEIQIEKIFPLNGKDNVIKDCKNNSGNKTKIYLVDKDFDDIINKKENIENLFYLERYSIENYLIEELSITEYIISEKPKLKRNFVSQNLNIDTSIEIIKNSLNELIYTFILVQKKCPKLKNISLNYERFFDFDNGNFRVKQVQVDQYANEVEAELRSIDKRYKFNSQLRKIKKEHDLSSNDNCVIHFHGKFIVKMLKQIIESSFGLTSRNVESFSYRIACNSKFEALSFLKRDINNYLN